MSEEIMTTDAGNGNPPPKDKPQRQQVPVEQTEQPTEQPAEPKQ